MTTPNWTSSSDLGDRWESDEAEDWLEENEEYGDRPDSSEGRLWHDLHNIRDDLGEEWRYGVTFISDEDFESYAIELAEDTGIVPDLNKWPFTCIDWEQAATDLSSDYTAYGIDRYTYYAIT